MLNSFKFFEAFSEIYKESRLQLQYKILFRRWDLLEDIDEESISTKIKKPEMTEHGIEWRDLDLTIQNLLEWNAGYYNKAKMKNISEKKEIDYYTDIIFGEENILDLFFLGNQPMLNVVHYEVQMRAAQHLNDINKPNFHMILDEVGTGKTVSALYCIRNIIETKKEQAKVLIICPNNKRAEWQKDIKRQLGLYSHITKDVGLRYVYKGNLKSFYFKNNEPAIFVAGQKSDELTSDLKKWSEIESDSWDLIVIDEGHQCFESYKQLKAKQAILLTATPIVINSTTSEGELKVSKVRDLNKYIQTLWDIVSDAGEENPYRLNNLFSSSDIFTQLFREDLGILPKSRNIVFKKCKRWNERQIYLDVLSSVKGGMTKLLYEQDDEYLVEGIFNKFKSEIILDGYIIDDAKPNIIDDKESKYNVLVEHIQLKENKNKSYIVFFNTKWPGNNLYEKLIKDKRVEKDNLIIAKKYGGKVCEVWPKDNTVGTETDNVFDYVRNRIDEGKRVIFITTGASGGTGLNLGEFDGVINYELPFTSLELEQRFGRVDRMDSMTTDEKEMLFILNDDENPMLRYSTLKVNKTCEYMPIRNTVLFYKEFIDANIDSLKMELEKCELVGEEYAIYEIVIDSLKDISNADQEFVKKFLKHIVKFRGLEEFSEDIDDKNEHTIEFIKLCANNLDVILKLYRIKKSLNHLEKEIKHWSNLLGKNEDISIDSNSSIVISDEVSDVDEDSIIDEYIDQGGLIRGESVLIEAGAEVNPFEFFTDEDLKAKYNEIYKKLTSIKESSDLQVATGLFYVRENKYYRQSVSEYRDSFKEVTYSG